MSLGDSQSVKGWVRLHQNVREALVTAPDPFVFLLGNDFFEVWFLLAVIPLWC